MCEDKKARIIIKQGNGVPTIPASSDHRNGDWIATDIYEGEQYLDLDTGVTYTRNGSGIITVGNGYSVQPRVYKALISQSSTSAPVLTELVNTFGITPATVYGGVGTYTITGFTGLVTGLIELNLTVANNGSGTKVGGIGGVTSTNIIVLNTYSSGALSNDILSNDASTNKYGSSVLTFIKYD